MTRTLIVLLSAVVTLGASAETWVPYNADAERQKAVAPDADRKIDFLIPSSVQTLEQRRYCLLKYDALPSFVPEYHWCVSLADQQYLLEAWTSSNSSPDVPVATWKTVLPPDVALIAREIWLSAILEARHPRRYLAGLDGTIFYFSAKRTGDNEVLRTQTWSPVAELPPLWLTQGGEALMKYAQSDSRSADALRAELQTIRNKLLAYYRGARSTLTASNNR